MPEFPFVHWKRNVKIPWSFVRPWKERIVGFFLQFSCKNAKWAFLMPFLEKRAFFQNLFSGKNAIKCQIMPLWHFFMYWAKILWYFLVLSTWQPWAILTRENSFEFFPFAVFLSIPSCLVSVLGLHVEHGHLEVVVAGGVLHRVWKSKAIESIDGACSLPKKYEYVLWQQISLGELSWV